jgi:hypothetical protein
VFLMMCTTNRSSLAIHQPVGHHNADEMWPCEVLAESINYSIINFSVPEE